MLGAIIGDIVGSRFEWNNIKTKEFDFMPHKCFFTDDSVMTLAVANAILECNEHYAALPDNTIVQMQHYGKKYPDSGYGGMFSQWITSDNPTPYNSFGNGSAMRVSACAYAAKNIDEAKELSKEFVNAEDGIELIYKFETVEDIATKDKIFVSEKE